jgi:hypothetical protein
MTVVVNRSFVSSSIPQNLAVLAIDAKDLDGVTAIAAHAVGMSIGDTSANVGYGLCAGNYGTFDRSGFKDLLAPDDW